MLDTITAELVLKDEELRAKTQQIKALRPPRKKMVKQAPNERFATIEQVKQAQQ